MCCLSHDIVDAAELAGTAIRSGLQHLRLEGSQSVGRLPRLFTRRSEDRLLTLRTSQPPMPMTLAPGRTVAMSAATCSVFSTLRPTMQALAPRRTSARVCMLQIVPAPPVTKTTRLSG